MTVDDIARLRNARQLVLSGWGQWRDNRGYITNCVLQANNLAAEGSEETVARLNTSILDVMTPRERQLARDWWSSGDCGEWVEDFASPETFYPIGFNNHPQTSRGMMVDLFDRAIAKRDEVDRLAELIAS